MRALLKNTDKRKVALGWQTLGFPYASVQPAECGTQWTGTMTALNTAVGTAPPPQHSSPAMLHTLCFVWSAAVREQWARLTAYNNTVVHHSVSVSIALTCQSTDSLHCLPQSPTGCSPAKLEPMFDASSAAECTRTLEDRMLYTPGTTRFHPGYHA